MIAAAGDIVTCEEGHRLYRITEDIPAGGKVFRARHFAAIHNDAPEPLPHTRIKQCFCGAAWFRQRVIGFPSLLGGGHITMVRVHFEDGWRPNE